MCTLVRHLNYPLTNIQALDNSLKEIFGDNGLVKIKVGPESRIVVFSGHKRDCRKKIKTNKGGNFIIATYSRTRGEYSVSKYSNALDYLNYLKTNRLYQGSIIYKAASLANLFEEIRMKKRKIYPGYTNLQNTSESISKLIIKTMKNLNFTKHIPKRSTTAT